jgi:hypothetical protein
LFVKNDSDAWKYNILMLNNTKNVVLIL